MPELKLNNRARRRPPRAIKSLARISLETEFERVRRVVEVLNHRPADALGLSRSIGVHPCDMPSGLEAAVEHVRWEPRRLTSPRSR